MIQTRRFDGKRYTLVHTVKQKRAADAGRADRMASLKADELRSRGKSARVVKTSEGYAVYARGTATRKGRSQQAALSEKRPTRVGGTKEFIYRLISKTTGGESFHKVTATSTVAAFNYLRAKYHGSTAFTFAGVYTKRQFAKIAWDADRGGMRKYVRPEKYRYTGFPGLPTALRRDLTEEAWEKYVGNTRHVKWITTPIAKEAVKAAGTGWMTV